MNFSFLVDDNWRNNNFELISSPTEHTKIARVLIEEDGTKKYYQRKTLTIYDIQQEDSVEQPNDWLSYVYEKPYQITAITIGVLSAVAFGYGLYVLSPKLMELMELSKNLDRIRNEVNYLSKHYNSLKQISIPKKVNPESINKFLKRLGYLDSSENPLKISTKKGLKGVHKEVINQLSNIISKMSEKTELMEAGTIKAFENIIFSPFTHLIPASTLVMLGAVYVYESLEDMDHL